MDSSTYFYKNVLPIASLIAVGIAAVGSNILFKAASIKGLSYFVFLFYNYLFNTLILLPVPFFLFRFWAVAAIGFLSQYMGYKGIKYSSPTMASVMSNLTPAWTFIFAVLFRMEKLALSSSISQSKIIGTLISIIGAFVAVFYTGPAILSTPSNTLLSNSAQHDIAATNSNWVTGGCLLAAQHILYAFIYIVQTQMMKICPSALLVSFFSHGATIIVSAPFCFIAENDLNAWKLKPDITLVALVYSTIGEALFGIIHMWCLHIKGPVYVVSFQPLSIAIAAVMSFLLLGDSLHLGRVIGGVIIAAGVYGVVWGQSKAENLRDESLSPLLEYSHKVEDHNSKY